MNCNGNEFDIKKRFSKFDELQERLAKTFGNLPELPSKTLMKITKAVELEKRRADLEKYLKVDWEMSKDFGGTKGYLF